MCEYDSSVFEVMCVQRDFLMNMDALFSRAYLHREPSAPCQCITCSSEPSPRQPGWGGIRRGYSSDGRRQQRRWRGRGAGLSGSCRGMSPSAGGERNNSGDVFRQKQPVEHVRKSFRIKVLHHVSGNSQTQEIIYRLFPSSDTNHLHKSASCHCTGNLQYHCKTNTTFYRS